MEQAQRKVERSALSTVNILLRHLPHNRNRVYLEIWLDESKCKLYLPLRDSQLADAKKIKDNLQAVFELAKL